MTMRSFVVRLTEFAPALKNHLWQSTLFLLIFALLAFVLRRNQARTRYWLWLAASMKFAVPCSLLVALGSHLATPRAVPAEKAAVYVAMEAVSQPFRLEEAPFAAHRPMAPAPVPLMPLVVAGTWVAGLFAVLGFWWVYWMRITAVVRRARPLERGREFELLRRLEGEFDMGVRSRVPIQLLASGSSLGPGIYGILRPKLILPEALCERLDDAHLESVLVHEICHVRRRDNLTAALHMLVEAVFWFHPLVWWLGARLEAERERACDEAVLLLIGRPHVYAESILKICEFYVESPLRCVSGVTGADLKKRIADILAVRRANPLSLAHKMLVLATATVAIAVPFVVGAQTSNAVLRSDWVKAAGGKMSFDVATIRLNKLGIPPAGPPPRTNVDLDPGDLYAPTGGVLRMQNKSLRTLIAFAYKMNGDQQLYLKEHVPDFVLSDRFDMEARTENQAVTKDQMRLMMQSLLADRFKIAMHQETIQATVLGLTPVKAGRLGPQIRPHADHDPVCSTNDLSKDETTWVQPKDGYPALCGSIVGMRSSPNHQSVKIGGRDVPMRLIAEALVAPYTGDTGLAHPVIDTTGLTGTFDFTLELEYTEMEPTFTPNTAPAFFEELNDQLGLKLQSQKGPEEVYVVDHVERLSAQDHAEIQSPTPTLQRVAFAQTEQVPLMPKDADPGFEVASIRPSDPNDTHLGFHLRGHRIFVENLTAKEMITFAYSLHPKQVVDAPDWLSTTKYDVDGVPDVEGQPNRMQYQRMVQKLLTDRFGLKFHRDKRDLSIYAITVAKGGAKLAATTEPGSVPNQNGDGHGSQQSMHSQTPPSTNSSWAPSISSTGPWSTRRGLGAIMISPSAGPATTPNLPTPTPLPSSSPRFRSS